MVRHSWVPDQFDQWHWRRWTWGSGVWFIPDKNTHCQVRIIRDNPLVEPPKHAQLCVKCRAAWAKWFMRPRE